MAVPVAATVAKDSFKRPDLDAKYWYLHGRAYDFTKYVPLHPGGTKAISLGQGRDCTALFESYHTHRPSDKLLEKYAVKGVPQIASDPSRFTFAEDGFYRTIKKRAVEYFAEEGHSHTKANAFGILSTVLNTALMCYFAYGAFVHGSVWHAIFHGVARALNIVRPTHAASHFAFTTNTFVNQLTYIITMAFCGTTCAQWTTKHVVAHHVDTNVTPTDDDTMYPVKRVLPSHKPLSFHKYQHIYIWPMYLFTTAFWTTSNVIKVLLGATGISQMYEGDTPVPHSGFLEWTETVLTLVFFVAHRVVLPFAMLPFSQAMLIFVISEVACSLWFALQFAVNHEVDIAIKNSGTHDQVSQPPRDFGLHQLATSHNYASRNPLALHVSGGLNLQIEHHLFPSVHYHHYFALQDIVRKTAKEFGAEYPESPTFFAALCSHYRLLKTMGSAPQA